MAEHAVLAYLKLSDDQFDTTNKRESIHELCDRLEEIIVEAGVGEFDGDEFGEGDCILYMYGPDADALFSAVESVLRVSPHAKGGYVIKRYGEASDPAAREIRVEL